MSVVERSHPLTPEASQASGVTYSEIRDWAVYLDYFTAEDLAAAMGVNVEIGVRGVRALLYHGICEPTGETLDGVDGELPIIHYLPLPPGPTEHFTKPPEWRTCMQDLVPPFRGYPIRLVDNTERRNQMQGTGGMRGRVKRRDAAYEAMIAAQELRREQQAAKRIAEEQGRVNRQKGKTRTHVAK